MCTVNEFLQYFFCIYQDGYRVFPLDFIWYNVLHSLLSKGKPTCFPEIILIWSGWIIFLYTAELSFVVLLMFIVNVLIKAISINQSWIFILATWCKRLTHCKRPWCWERLKEEKGMTEGEMVGWHHQLNGHEFEQAPGVGDGQGSLACCSPWGCKESDMTGQLTDWLTDWSVYIILVWF